MYTFGKCNQCGQYKALKNNVCARCNNKNKLPDFMKDLLNKKGK